MHMRAALYVRVSTEDQAQSGYSLDAQVKKLEAYCRVRSWDIAGIYRDEGYSGRSKDRPAYTQMMDESDDWDILLVLKMDRIHRNSMNFTTMMEELNQKGKQFNSVQDRFDTTTSMGRFVMDIMQRIAQLESEQIGERVYNGMEQKAKEGKGYLGGGHPYGYKYEGGKLNIIHEEAITVRAIFNMALRGSNYSDIARYLNEAGIAAKKGGKWGRQTVSVILHNPVYAGYKDWDGIVRQSDHDPIVDLNVYERINGSIEIN